MFTWLDLSITISDAILGSLWRNLEDFRDMSQMKTEKCLFMRYLLTAILRLYFHPAKFDNFKDEKMSDYKSVSVAQSKTLLD